MKYQRLKNLAVLATAAAYFAATFPGQKMKRRILCEKLLIMLKIIDVDWGCQLIHTKWSEQFSLLFRRPVLRQVAQTFFS